MRRNILKNRRGQFVIEGILLMVVMLGVFTVLTKVLREQAVITKMVTGPWAKIAGMTEFGVWAEANKANRQKHPNSYDRFYTPKGE